MTDRELAVALTEVQALKVRLRHVIEALDVAEQDQATVVYRLVKPLEQKLQTWIAVRALRATLDAPARVS